MSAEYVLKKMDELVRCPDQNWNKTLSLRVTYSIDFVRLWPVSILTQELMTAQRPSIYHEALPALYGDRLHRKLNPTLVHCVLELALV